MLDLQKKTDILFSKKRALGMGCWAIGGRDWGSQLDSDSIDALKTAFELGITHFDTAQAYGKGHSEELIGKSLHKVRSEIFIASKMMYSPPDNVEKLLMQSLQRLKTDYIDLFYIHWPKRNVSLSAMMEKLVELKEKGIIRAIGVSNFSIDQMREVMKIGQIDAHQMCYNLLWRLPEREMISFCKQNDISVISYGTIGQGILTGKFQLKTTFAPDDHRKNTVLFGKDIWQDVYNAVQQFKEVALTINRPLIDCAIQWVIQREGIRTVLVGARNSNQVRQNAAAIKDQIDNNALDKLTEISDRVIKLIPEEGNIFRWYP